MWCGGGVLCGEEEGCGVVEECCVEKRRDVWWGREAVCGKDEMKMNE